MEEGVTLTKQEIEDIKDETKFRTKVIMQLKALNGIPDRVIKAESKLLILMWLVPIILGVFGVITVLAR